MVPLFILAQGEYLVYSIILFCSFDTYPSYGKTGAHFSRQNRNLSPCLRLPDDSGREKVVLLRSRLRPEEGSLMTTSALARA